VTPRTTSSPPVRECDDDDDDDDDDDMKILLLSGVGMDYSFHSCTAYVLVEAIS